jgi:hypothetical protein
LLEAQVEARDEQAVSKEHRLSMLTWNWKMRHLELLVLAGRTFSASGAARWLLSILQAQVRRVRSAMLDMIVSSTSWCV